ncbi:MAG: hypothetical protein AB8F95_17000 [Bacteroidia bacterium]
MKLPSYLFWDTDLDSIDFSENARFIIQRVIQKGSLEDWVTIKEYYGLEFIKKEILLMRNLDARTHTFFSAYFGISKYDFRCYFLNKYQG